jgi:hypothetical protein
MLVLKLCILQAARYNKQMAKLYISIHLDGPLIPGPAKMYAHTN